MAREPVPTTPDGRYIVVRGRLWRRANPGLPEVRREALVQDGLGERGPPWWTDGAPDYNRHLARNTPYAAWFAGVEEG
jgi:hypothetical protein